jgi:ElaB/YqjD/DUF883 family membrane-anchored ribosome-binding protein
MSMNASEIVANPGNYMIGWTAVLIATAIGGAIGTFIGTIIDKKIIPLTSSVGGAVGFFIGLGLKLMLQV